MPLYKTIDTGNVQDKAALHGKKIAEHQIGQVFQSHAVPKIDDGWIEALPGNPWKPAEYVWLKFVKVELTSAPPADDEGGQVEADDAAALAAAKMLLAWAKQQLGL
jgi:hypothetical protein